MKKDDLASKKKFWDLRSEEFLNTLKNLEHTNDTNTVIEYLKNKKILTEKSKVLDIGCGTGRYAISMAKYVNKVVAIDISSEMIKLGSEYASSKGINNIEWIEVAFENIIASDPKFSKQFDLVFAYNSGAIIDDASIEKLLNITKNAFFINGFLKRKHNFLELIRINFFPKSVPEDIEEKIALENLMSLLKKSKFQNEIKIKEDTLEKTFFLEKISLLYSQFLTENSENIIENQKKIYEFLKPYSKNGEITEKTDIKTVSIYCEIS